MEESFNKQLALIQRRIFNLNHEDAEFENIALQLFSIQYQTNKLYKKYCQLINRNPKNVDSLSRIPFLPISSFKSGGVKTGEFNPEETFYSSGTSKTGSSQHLVKSLELYKKSFFKNIENNYGSINDYCVLALLPSYLEREGSSLVYMVDSIIKKSNYLESGFFLDDFSKLNNILSSLLEKKTKTILIGVSFALLDFISRYQFNADERLIVMETGGMKGRRKEMIRGELHDQLKVGFGLDHIHSEYGMTELLSQAYAQKDGVFSAPPWMRVLIRKNDDPYSYCKPNETGGINIIDLANIYSSAFVQTDDVGKVHLDGTFEVLGRFDNTEVRGCNLLYT